MNTRNTDNQKINKLRDIEQTFNTFCTVIHDKSKYRGIICMLNCDEIDIFLKKIKEGSSKLYCYDFGGLMSIYKKYPYELVEIFIEFFEDLLLANLINNRHYKQYNAFKKKILQKYCFGKAIKMRKYKDTFKDIKRSLIISMNKIEKITQQFYTRKYEKVQKISNKTNEISYKVACSNFRNSLYALNDKYSLGCKEKIRICKVTKTLQNHVKNLSFFLN